MHPHGGQPAAPEGTPGKAEATPGKAEALRRDDTTRYLCAAAHLSSDFADRAIREYLIEPTRPMPSAPGVDAAAVLNEAVASRARRMLRDWAVVLLALPLIFVTPTTWLLGWVAISSVLAVVAAGARQRQERGEDNGVGQAAAQRRFAGFAAGAAVVLLVVIFVYNKANEDDRRSDYDYEDGAPGYSLRHVLALLLVLAIVAVLAADRVAVWNALTQRFRRVGGRGYDTGARQIHDFAPARQNRQVARLREAQEEDATRTVPGGADVPLTVYRGYSPFVGAGREIKPWSTATSLIPLPEGPEHALPGEAAAQIPTSRPGDDEPPTEQEDLNTEALYDRVRAEITELIRSTPLTPGRRLRELTVSGQLIASAEELIDHLDDANATLFLPSLDKPPSRWIPRDAAASLRADPEEWARYYQCMRVETWDRELVVSVYLHLAVDRSTLYVEWTPCLLMPIKRQFQAIDNLSSSALVPVWQALGALLQFPASLPGRVLHMVKWLRPLPVERGVNNPARYGSLRSIRELAADVDVHNYLQRADVDRYLKILESRFVLVISRILREFGYSSLEFDRQAATVVTNNVFIESNFNAPVVTGGRVGGNVSASGAMTVPAQPAK
jgi:hypothetical protein